MGYVLKILTKLSNYVRVAPFVGLWRRLTIDQTVIFGIARVGWTAAAALVTLVFVAKYTSAPEQGYFYTFLSFFQLQAAFQAGAYVALYAAISHAWARLDVDGDGRIVGTDEHLAHLGGLMRLSRRWHLGCAVAFAVGLGPLGHVFFATVETSTVHWQAPWWCTSLAIAVSFLVQPDGLALEATGRTGVQQRAMFWGQFASSLSGLAALAAGWGLYAVAVMTVVRLLVTGVSYRRQSHAFRGLPEAVIKWREEILPQQVKITASWLLGYAVYLSAVPITFQAAGPLVAGRLGVVLQLHQTVVSAAAVWITRAQPRMGELAARKAYPELHRLTLDTGLRSTVFGLLFAIGTYGIVLMLKVWAPGVGARFPGSWAVVLFLTAGVAGQMPSAMAAAVRLMRIEPFIPLVAVSAVLMVLVYATLGGLFGETGIAAGFLAVTVLLLFPGQAVIYWRRVGVRSG